MTRSEDVERETEKTLPPSPPAPPVVGHALSYARNPLDFITRSVSNYGPVVSFRIPRHNAILLSDPDAIEYVLARNASNFRKGDFQRRELEGILGDGLLISEGQPWKDAREALQPAFYPRQITDYASMMVDCTDQHLHEWGHGQEIDIMEEMSEITLTILGDILFNTDFRDATAVRNAARAVSNRFAPDSKLPIYIPDWVPLPRIWRYRRSVKYLDEFVYSIIQSRRNEPTTPDRNDIVSILLAAGMDDQEIRDHLVTFLLAGHETTALALTYTLFCLATHPDEQTAVIEEVTSLDGRPTASDSLPQTDRAIREAMRLYPPVHLIMREAEKADRISGYHIPKDALVVCSQWATHRRSSLYDNPETYQPNRWERGGRQDYSYFPFGGGPRVCIGRRFALLEARLVLATLLQEVRFEAITKELDLTAAMTLTPAHPVMMRLKKHSL